MCQERKKMTDKTKDSKKKPGKGGKPAQASVSSMVGKK